MKRLLPWFLLIIPLLAGGYPLWRKLATPLPVRAARVTRGPALSTVFATGWIEPKERRFLRPPRPALVDQILAKEGDEIRAGMPLVRLRDTAREVKQERVQAELDRIAEDLAEGSALRRAAQARIDEAQINQKWAAAEVERSRPLATSGLLEQRALQQLESLQAAADQRVTSEQEELAQALSALEMQKRQAQAELATLKAAARDDEIVAPFDGVVLQRFAEEGESVNPERELLKFGDLRELLVEGEVDEEDLPRVRVGQAVLVRLAGDLEQVVPGEVSELFPDANHATRSYRVRVRFPGATFVADGAAGLRGRVVLPPATPGGRGQELFAGTSVELGIVVERRADALIFPRIALTSRGTVFLLNDGRVRERSVDVGIRNFDLCEARQGLVQGDLVAIESLGSLKEGRRVEAVVAPPPADAADHARKANPANPASPPQGGVVELGGGPVDPLATPGARAVVLLFTRSDCPISNRYAPEVRRLIDHWSPQGVAFWLVYVDPTQTTEEVRQHVTEYGYSCKVALDPGHLLVAQCAVKVTPEAALFTPDGRLAYCGRIDDRFAEVGVARVEPTTHDLEEALTAVLAGRPPAVARTTGIGCLIEDLR